MGMEISVNAYTDHLVFDYGGWFGPKENREYRGMPRYSHNGEFSITPIEYLVVSNNSNSGIWLSGYADDAHWEGAYEDYVPVAQERIRKHINECMQRYSFLGLLTLVLNNKQKLEKSFDVRITARKGCYVRWTSGDMSGKLSVKATEYINKTVTLRNVTPEINVSTKDYFTWIENGKVTHAESDTSTNVWTDIPVTSYIHEDMSLENANILVSYEDEINNILNAML